MSYLLVVALLFSQGRASQYDPGVMERVIAHRQIPGYVEMSLPVILPPVAAFVAVSECGRIGDVVLIRSPGGEWERALITDCAGSPETRAWMGEGNILVEIDHLTAARWETVGRMAEVEVLEIVVEENP